MGVAIAVIELNQIGRRDFEIRAERAAIQARVFEVALDEHAEDVDGAGAIDDHPNVLAGPDGPQDFFNTR